MTLDYRSPSTAPHRVQRVLVELDNAEAMGWIVLAGKALLGAAACFIGPVFIAFVFKAAELQRGDMWLPAFWPMVALTAVVLVPLLMWLERRSRGEFFLDAVRGETSPLEASSYGEYQLQSTKFLWAFYTEVALLGPRLVWDVIDSLRGQDRDDSQLRFAAAQIVVELFDTGTGVHPNSLRRPDRPTAVVVAALQYLNRRDWIGISRRRDRVWLSSAVREKLAWSEPDA